MFRSHRQRTRTERAPALEALETRRLLATFTVNGTAGPDLITLSAGIGFITANVNGTPTSQATSNVTDIVINGLAGNDIIRIENNAGKPTTVNGGDGDEFIDFSYASRDLDFITGSTTVRGGAGNDGIFVYDDNNLPQEDYFITDERFDRDGWGGFFYAADIESLSLWTGKALDRVWVSSTYPNQPVTVNSAGGNDVVAVGDAFGMHNIRAPLTIRNDNGLSNVWLQNASDESARHVTVDVVGGLTQVDGIAPAPIRMRDISGLLMSTGYANDTVDILRIPAHGVGLENRAGIDAVNLGNPVNGVQSINGGVLLRQQPEWVAGRFTLNVNNGPDTLGRNVVVNHTPPTTTASERVDIDGLAPASIGFHVPVMQHNAAITITNGSGNDNVVINGTVPNRLLQVNGGNGNDVFTVNQTSFDSFTWIDGDDGTDTINVKETRTSGPITIMPSRGDDHLTVNDGFGTAHVVFGGTQTLGSLTINGGPDSHALIPAGTNRVLTVKSLSIGGPGAVLDLAENDLIVDYTGASPIASIQAWLTNGYNGGAWNGQGGINTSAATSARGLGFAEASETFTTFPATFSGQSVDNTAVLVKYTFYGDANLDGTVNASDFNKLAANLGQSPRRWVHGNFDYDADVDMVDFNRLAANFGASGLGPNQTGSGSAPLAGQLADVEDLDDLAQGLS